MNKVFTRTALSIAVLQLALLTGCSQTNPAEQHNTATSDSQTNAAAAAILLSPNDERQYRVVTLANQLQVLLISDPSSQKSAAALSVGVGMLQDPMNHQGMAHYLEHMLFLGTERYPDTKGYSEFMAANGGAQNAYTWLDITNYMFKVNNDAYDEALDRFSDFFKAPKLYKEYSDKEKNAVHAEWSMRREMDFFGQYALGAQLLGEHPANRFLIGNLESLSDKPGDSLHSAMLKFYQQYYSANQMRAVLLSNLPLAQMQTLAQKHFASIPNKQTKRPVVTAQPDLSKAAGQRIHYVPNEDVKQLRLEFIIKNNKSQFASKPNEFVSYLLGSEMPGTVTQQLKTLGLIASLGTTAMPDLYGNYGSFFIDVELTDTGMQQRERIVAELMRYLALVRRDGVDPKYFQEIKTSYQNKFRFLEKTDEFGYVANLADNMQLTPSRYVVAADYVYESFDRQAIADLTAQLTPSQLRVWYISKQEPHNASLHFYDGKYQLSTLSAAEIHSWQQAGELSLQLPAVNSLMPQDFTLKQASQAAVPELRVSNDQLKIWYAPSTAFASQPRGFLEIHVNTNAAERSIKAAVLQQLWRDLYQQQQGALQAEASAAGMGLELDTANGLVLSVDGFTDQQPALLRRALAGLAIKVEPAAFAQAVDRYVRNLQNSQRQFPIGQAFNHYQQLISADGYNDSALSQVATELTPADLTGFVQQTLSAHQLRVMAFGNYDQAALDQLAMMLSSALPAKRQNIAYQPEQEWRPEPGKTLVIEQDLPVSDTAVLDMLYHPTPTVAVQAAGLVLEEHFSNVTFETLRTEEQLAYAVTGGQTRHGDYSGFYLAIQTPVKNVAAMQQRFDDYKQQYAKVLATLSEADFQRLKQSTLVTLGEPAKNLRDEVQPLVADWYRERFSFDSKAKLINAVAKLQLADLQDYYRQTMLNPKAARISVQLRGSKFADQPFAKIKDASKITDLATFHQTMPRQ